MFRANHVRDFADRLRTYFNREPEMLNEIRRNPLFIYVVLYDCFNNFNTILYQFERLYQQAVGLMGTFVITCYNEQLKLQ